MIEGGNFIDIELDPEDNTIAYASGNNITTVWKLDLDNPNQNTELQDLGFLVNSGNYNIDDRQISIEISNGAPDYLFIVVSIKDSEYSQLFRYDLANNDWIDKGILPTGGNGGGGSAGISRGSILAWKVSPELTSNNELRMVHGSVSPIRMSSNLLDDELCIWVPITEGYNNPIHPDYRFMTFDNFRNLWVCSDGGIYYTTIEYDPSEHWQRKNNGLAIATVYFVATSEPDRNIILSGQHDDGTNIYKPVSDNDWSERWVWGGDGYKPYCDFTDGDIMYASSQNCILGKSTDHGNTFTSFGSPGWAPFPTFYTNNFADPSILYSTGTSYPRKDPNWNSNKWGIKKYENGSWNRIEKFEDQFSFISNSDLADPSTFRIATTPADPDYIYASWRGTEGTGEGQHIFKSTVGGGQGANDWSDVGESPIGGWIMDIAIDDDEPDHIYVAASAYNQSIVYSVDIDDETGVYVWSPLKSNFNFNINCLAFDRESTNHTIYLGTDMGLYYTNDELEDWVNVTGSLPNTYINDLEINYNKRTLTAGLFGRGVWEASLADCNFSNEPIVITGNETWNTDQTINSDVIIENGASLTIQATIKFVPEAVLIVKQGGQLGIDGGVLTNTCNDLWQGVEVWGDATHPDNLPYQGQVTMRNATIKNAVCGIKTVKIIHDEQKGDYADLKHAGGIVKALNSYFINNETSVRFYKYPYSGLTYTSSSYFTNCQFITNDFYYFEYGEPTFVKMSGINTVRVNYCTFDNQTENYQYGTGIYSFDSKFFVQGNQNGDDWTNGLFHNLKFGIYATVSGSEYYAEIEHTTFDDNFRGVYVSGMSTPLITNNNFEINTPYVEDGGYGLYLDRSTAYKVEENNFIHENGNPVGVGLIVNNSGTEPNIIYRNWFTNLECGMDIQGENRAKSGEGLQLKCNQYDQTAMDKIITWDEQNENPQAGIAANQGADSQNPEDMAGNLFQIDGQTPNGDYDDILNEGNHITYYYPLNYGFGYDNVKPVDYTKSTVDLKKTTVSTQWTFENGCPSNENGGGGGTGTDDGLKSSMAQTDQKIDSTSNLLALLIDGGNTEAIQTEVDNSVPPQTMDVYNELMNKSPYLSDTVVSTAIEKEDVLPAAMIRDIMVANPKSAKSDMLINKLDERWDPLPDYMKGQILQGRSIVSIREETESRLAAFRLERAGYFNALVRYYLNDTVNPQASSDSLKALLQTENSLNAKYMLAFLQAQQGDWSQGAATLNAIPSAFELTAAQQSLHQQMTAYFSLLSDLAADNKSVTEADSAQIATLKTIEQADAGIASVYARNILLALNQSDYEEPVILPDMLKSAMIDENYQNLINKAKKVTGTITIRPNPAKDYVIVGYDFETETAAVVEITGADGKTAYSKNVNGQKDQFTVDTRNWKPGVYVATVKIDGKIKESVKFTVVR